MPNPGIILGGASIVGGILSSRSARKAADAQAAASDAAIAEQRRQFDTLLSLGAPARAIGNQALNALGAIYGYTPYAAQPGDIDPVTGEPVAAGQALSLQDFIARAGGLESFGTASGAEFGLSAIINAQRAYEQYKQNPAAYDRAFMPTPGGGVRQIIPGGTAQPGNALAAPDYSRFFASPDYQFRLREGLDAVQGSAAARGGLYSGNALRGITEFGQNLAASEFGNYFNRQAALAGIGQTATTQAGQGALATGANVGNLLVNAGNARASGIINQGNALANTGNQLALLYGMGAFGGGYKPDLMMSTGYGVPYGGMLA